MRLPSYIPLRCYSLILPCLLACGGVMDGFNAVPSATDGDGGSESSKGDSKPDDKPPSDAGSVDSEPDAQVSPAGPIEPDQVGPYVVGTLRVQIGARGGRTLPMQLWYPAVEAARAEAAAGRPLADIEPAGARRELLAALVAAAPEGCTRKTFYAADAPTPLQRAEPWPAVVFSHCKDCTRFSSFSSAERLASWGFIVAAPDHEGGTLYDAQAGRAAGLTGEFLETRAQDISSVIDVLLDPASLALPEALRGKIDPENIGMFGHSYGSVTTGLVLQNDKRVKAAVMIAAPPENPLLGKVSIDLITQPTLFLLAREDNSITEAGNITIRNNYDEYPTEAWLVEVLDAGHYSFSDLCGLVDGFQPGCGTGIRQTTTGTAFTYLDNDIARGIASGYTVAYFGRVLVSDAIAAEYLKLPQPRRFVTIAHHK